jgi:hypothetical protein
MLRNQFEHYDEELDDWFFARPRGNILIDSVLTYSYQLDIQRSLIQADYFRIFLQDKWVLLCRGESLSFRDMIAAVKKLQASLQVHPPTKERGEQDERPHPV